MLNAKEYTYTNDLINEDSPYLLQHAHNPVNWMAWNNKTLQKAKKEDKFIFLSIGYSTCHWCHVMEHESFEDEQIAKILNKNYISIKVDREEMPTLDSHFQDIFHIMNRRSGGWPLTIILTPDQKVFFSATYIPKLSRNNMNGLLDLLTYFIELKNTNYKKILDNANELTSFLTKQRNSTNNTTIIDIPNSITYNFVNNIEQNFDNKNAGIGNAPKFPHASTLNTLLDIYINIQDKQSLKMATDTLDAMANGGIYDQIESGFYRYSTDEAWQIPHFEKMLYTNAELLEIYAKAYDITKKPLYKQIVQNLVSFMDKRFKYNNLFYSASDADSLDNNTNHKEEGAYFVYSYDEVINILKKSNITNISEILNYFNITPHGNFEQNLTNIYISKSASIPTNLQEVKQLLQNLRDKRAYPFIDNKILTAWNALYIQSLFKASNIDKKYINKAKLSLDTLLNTLIKDNQLYHQVIFGKSLKIKAILEDYSFLINTLLCAYQYTDDTKYLNIANTLTQKAINEFYINNIWYSSNDDFKIKANLEGNAYRSYLAIMIDNFLKLSLYEENLEYQDFAKNILETYTNNFVQYPAAYSDTLSAYLAYKSGYIIIKSPKDSFKELKQKVLQNIDYKYILFKQSDEKEFLACRVDTCFAYANNIDDIILKIKKDLNK